LKVLLQQYTVDILLPVKSTLLIVIILFMFLIRLLYPWFIQLQTNKILGLFKDEVQIKN